MSSLALIFVLCAAVLHASWNYCAKKAGGGLPFVYLVGLAICSFYIPVLAIYIPWKHPALSLQAIAWILGSGILKTGYSLFLQRGYRHGDFSVVYPLARGTGPLLSTIGAVLILGERPSLLVVAGGAVIVASIFVLTGGEGLFQLTTYRRRDIKSTPAFKGLVYGIGSGLWIAAYTLWDRRGVGMMHIPPVVYDAGTAFTQLALLTPLAIPRWSEVAAHWRDDRRYVMGMAIMAPVAYVLILCAMSFTPVSYIAPAREISIVIGAFIGLKVLKETGGRRRLWCAAAMAAGIIALSLG